MENLDPDMVRYFQAMMTGGADLGGAGFPKKNFYDKVFLLNAHDKTLAKHDNNYKLSEGEKYNFLQQTSTPAQHSSSRVDLVAANQITISKLVKSIDQVLLGKFLLCRVIAPAFKITALAMVVDDPPGVKAVRLCLYNYTQDVGHLPLPASVGILPVGTILAIKNPWFKTTVDGGLSLRCDNPDDVVVMKEAALQKLNPDLKWEEDIPARFKKYMAKQPENDSDWKRLGNEHFVSERYMEAIEAYTNGLKSGPPNIDLIANRAAAYLKIRKFEEALTDAEKVLEANKTHLKAIFRKTKALWGLQMYEDAYMFLKAKILPILPKNDQVQKLWTTTKQMISQSRDGHYPMEAIAKSDCLFSKTHCQESTSLGVSLDWADFSGPVVVKPTGDERGRGIFATKNIVAGQLLLANKAFEFVFRSKDSKDQLISINTDTKLANDASQVQLVSSIAQRLRNNPALGKQVYKLYAGPKLGALNPETDDCSLIDIKRIDAICTFNAFGDGTALDFDQDRSSGLWILPSFINHNCIDCNCCWTVYGDFLLLRAFKDIQEGEEVTISYTNTGRAYSEREEFFQKFGFECKCRLCKYERNEPVSVKQEKEDLKRQIEQLKSASETWWHNPKAANSVLPKIERLLQLRLKFNLFLVPVLNNMATHFSREGNSKQSANFLEKCYNISEHTPLRVEICHHTINLIMMLIQGGQKKKAQHWCNILKKVFISTYGTADVIESFYPEFVKQLKDFGTVFGKI